MRGRNWVELILIVLACAAAGLTFSSAFVGWSVVPTVCAAAVLASGIAVLAFRAKVSPTKAVAASLVALVSLGTIVIYGAPSISALGRFVEFAVGGWRKLLTVAVPTGATSDLRVVPFTAVWFGSAIAAEAALRTRQLLTPLAGVGLILGIGALLGLRVSAVAPGIGIGALVAVALFLAVRHDESSVWQQAESRLDRLRTLGMVAMMVLAAASVAAVGSSVLAGQADAETRVTLRDVVRAPFEIRNLRTPLVGFKDSLDSEAENVEVMTVTGPDMAGRRVRLAVLDSYDGVTWSAAATTSDSGLQRVGPRFPGLVGDENDRRSERQDFEIRLTGLAGNWLPTVGVTEAVAWKSGAEDLFGDDLFARLRVDTATGSLLVDRPLERAERLTYTVTSYDLPPTPSLTDRQVRGRPLISSQHADPFAVLAAEIVGQEADPVLQLRRLEEALRVGVDGGKRPAYDVEAPPGHAIYRVADTLFGSETEYRGTAEQYATAFALMATSLDIPTRLVVGYEVSAGSIVASEGAAAETASLNRSDLSVWVEVPFEDLGWVAFEAGPDESAAPENRPTAGGGESALPETPPIQSVETPPTRSEDDPAQDDEDLCEGAANCGPGEQSSSPGVPTAVVYGVAGLGLPLLAVGAAVLAVLMLKRRRRQRRQSGRPEERVSGAWTELLDLSSDAQLTLRPHLTISERAREIGQQVNDREPVLALASVVERSAFGSGVVSDAESAEAWKHLEEVENILRRDCGFVDRSRQKVSLRSIRAPASSSNRA